MDVNVLDNGMTHFHRFYVCFKGVKDGWIVGCRRVIGINGYFITHMCNGQLLTAMGRDGNNQMYPITWEVVDVENKNNCIDTYQGLIEAMRAWLPQDEHRHYTRQLYANFKRKWVGLHYKRLFWSAAVSTIEQDFTNKMKEIRHIVKKASVFAIVALSAVAAVSAQATAPAPSPDAGAAFSFPMSGVVIGSSMLLSFVGLFWN
ncbi:hypothetical protein Tco_0429203 [Tanacetum coccineum]